ncbi:DUF3016 domain-containing protein [Methylobacterium soli]|uniref:DUF3016 domain-containing protein n=1 Tax=Methylobacterium soli TaxID=553447 RepID=A0A6L3SW92_9HYPH|nr:DUF3016 domain-containing protein [Methylobacterium soli]KAB1077891.1 DUF3016 domain-containing protein [Methylobacterium soli]GJE42087.1 hypothetical protein AEGHOMDF_1258 [Methylobacterium soli]
MRRPSGRALPGGSAPRRLLRRGLLARTGLLIRTGLLALCTLPALADPATAQGSVRPSDAAQGDGPRVNIRYVAPERFTDAENRFTSGPPLRVTLAEMTRILEDLARPRLRAGETLDLAVLDIDLAGFEQPSAALPTGLRVVRDVTPPRIRLAYTLRRGRRVLAQGEDVVTDINFLLTSNARFSTGPLYYERAVLRDWFARRFPEGRPTRD